MSPRLPACPLPLAAAALLAAACASTPAPAPEPSAAPVAALDLETAYQLQRAYVAQRALGEPIAGYKAGLTSKPSQTKFGVDGPLAGVLFDGGARAPGATFRAGDHGKLMVETEIGFVLGAAVQAPLADTAAAQAAVRAVVAAIELPDLGLIEGAPPSGPDIAAANVAANAFILGAEHSVGVTDLAALRVTLDRDGERINEGRGADAMGDPWDAFRWVVERMLAQRMQLKPGQVVITGALGQMQPAEPGAYRGDFGPLGTIEFAVTP